MCEGFIVASTFTVMCDYSVFIIKVYVYGIIGILTM